MNRLSKQYRLQYDRAAAEHRDAARGLWGLDVVSPGVVSLTRTGTLIDKSDPRLQSTHNRDWSSADEAAHDERTTNQASDLFLTGFSFQADDQQS